jgi:hypothetical protein
MGSFVGGRPRRGKVYPDGFRHKQYPNCAVPEQTPPPETQGPLTITTADFFVQIHSRPTGEAALHALVARLNGALGGLCSITSTRTDPTGLCELVASVVPASAWAQAWAILRTHLNCLGVIDDAHVSVFIVAANAAEAKEDRVLWVGRNIRDA